LLNLLIVSLLAITPAKELVLAPDVSLPILRTLSQGLLLGEGSYAAVWQYRDVAIKLTSDIASVVLANRLVHQTVPGLPRVFNVERDVASDEWGKFHGVTLELLTPLTARQFTPIKRAYADCKAEALSEYRRDVPKQSVYLARLLSERLLRSRSQVFGDTGPACVSEGLAWLADFMEEYGFCADIGHRSNWMMSKDRGIVMADPVVTTIFALDATTNDSPQDFWAK
jgi:hypothetical protein